MANGLARVQLTVTSHAGHPRPRRQIVDAWQRRLKAENQPNLNAYTIERTIKRMCGEMAEGADQRYPSVETTWYWSHALRAVGHPWSWPPLAYLAFGHFPAFVECMATCETSIIAASEICDLIYAISPLMDRGEIDYHSWMISEEQGRVFLHPDEARFRFEKHRQHRRFWIAHALANNFELSYEYQMFGIIDQFVQWATEFDQRVELF